MENAARYDPHALPYTQWVASVKHSMPLAPACIEGPVEELPSHLCDAFDQACALLPPAHPKQHITEKQEVLQGLGLQIVNLGLWSAGQPPISRLLSGMEPINSLNVEAANDSSLRLRHGLEAFDCIFFITAIFFTIAHIRTPYSPSEFPVSWVPYTIPPSCLPSKVDRTSLPELAHRALRFRDHKSIFNFSPSVSDPNTKASGSTVSYWTSCAGIGGRGITSHLSALVLKLLRCQQLYEEQVWMSEVPQLRVVAHVSSQNKSSFVLMKTTPHEEWAGNHQSSPISMLSPVLLLLKTPIAIGNKPTPKSYFWVNSSLI